MSLQRIVVDNSAMLPAYFPEGEREAFDAGLVTNRSRALVQAIRARRVDAYVPPSFFREFLNVATAPLDMRGGRDGPHAEHIRNQWDDVLSLKLIPVPVQKILHQSGILVFDYGCPAADAWYVAAAMHASATLWMSHEHRDGLAAIAAQHVEVRLLSEQAPDY